MYDSHSIPNLPGVPKDDNDETTRLCIERGPSNDARAKLNIERDRGSTIKPGAWEEFAFEAWHAHIRAQLLS
jgi:hypothetical protein